VSLTVGPSHNPGVFKIEVIQISHRAGRLYAYYGIRLGDARRQLHRECDLFLAIGESFMRPGPSTFEPSDIVEKMPFAGFLHRKPVFLNYRFDWQLAWLVQHGRLSIWRTAP
jgi:hypothetical protein